MKALKKLIIKLKSKLGGGRQAEAGGGVLRNMLILASGSSAAKLIGIVTIPLLTRMYSPEHMGVLSTFVAISTILVPLGTLRYSMAIPLPRRDALALNLAVLCMCITALTSTLVFGFFYFFSDVLMAVFSMEKLQPYWWLFFLIVLGASFYEILHTWAVRKKAFSIMAKSSFVQAASGSLVKLGLGFLGFKPLGLLLGHVVSQAGGILSLGILFFKSIFLNSSRLSRKRMAFLFFRFGDFPKYRLPSQFLLAFSSNAPLVFSAWLFGAETTGQLGLAFMALAMPLNILGNTTGQAYYAEISRIGKRDAKKIYEITKDVTRKLFLMGLPPFLFLVFLGPYFFDFVFGEEWRQAGVFASALSVCLLMRFVSTPIVNSLSVFGKQKIFLKINIVRSVGVVAVFMGGYFFGMSPLQVVLVYSFALAAHYVFTTFEIYGVIRHFAVSDK